MKRLFICLVTVAAVFGVVGLAIAGNTTTQTVTYQVAAINEISVSGNPGALVVNTATAGSEPDPASDATTTYAITTNEESKKITGKIDTAMPNGTTLKIKLTAPTGASSTEQALSINDADLVTGITKKAESGLTITYTFSATVAAGVVDQASKTVTLAIASAGP